VQFNASRVDIKFEKLQMMIIINKAAQAKAAV